jgi:hypothetical protein
MWLAWALAYVNRPMSQIDQIGQIDQQPRFAKRGCFGLKGSQVFLAIFFWGRFFFPDF